MNTRLGTRCVTSIITTIMLFTNAGVSTLWASDSLTKSPSSSSSNSLLHASSTAFTQVEAEQWNSIGLRADGTVWTWGRNDGLMESPALFRIVSPARLDIPAEFVMIKEMGQKLLGLKKDGTVWLWESVSQASKSSTALHQVPSLTDVDSISTLGNIMLALKKDGTVWGWHYDIHSGQSSIPLQIKGLVHINSIGTSSYQMAHALDSAGTVWVFTVTIDNKEQVVFSKPTKLENLPELHTVSAYSPDQMYGITSSGTTLKWGIDMSTSKIRLSMKPRKIYPALKMQSVDVHRDYAALLTTDGELWIDGKRPTGKGGHIVSLKRFKQVSAGEYHVLAIDTQGKVWGFGANKWNEIGIPSTRDSMVYTPQLVRDGITIKVNGEVLYSPYTAVMNNQLISVPLRQVVEALDAKLVVSSSSHVGPESRLYTITNGLTSASFEMNQPEVSINGRVITLSSTPYLETNAVMIPAALLKKMGYQVNWNAQLAELQINSNE